MDHWDDNVLFGGSRCSLSSTTIIQFTAKGNKSFSKMIAVFVNLHFAKIKLDYETRVLPYTVTNITIQTSK